MFPLVPHLISEELNLIVALLIGIAFGFILEQAGFSSSKKLAGVFYGYDFTVLRVFFTAGVTAMIGIILLGHLGWLDTDFIYVNPTFLPASILGGVIMGFGFIIGGFCPGTSICGLAIGKIDAAFFVVGGFLGVFLYAELYPWFAPIANAGSLGPIRIFDSLGISMGLFGLILTVVAVGAFIITTKIEQRVQPEGPSRTFHKRQHILAGSAAIVLGGLLLFLPDYKERLLTESADPEFLRHQTVREMTADELAFRLIDRDPHVMAIDLRDDKAFSTMMLPGAIHMTIRDILKKEYSVLFDNRQKKKVLISNNETDARIAAVIAARMGYENIFVLCGGFESMQTTLFEPQPSNAMVICPFTAVSQVRPTESQLPMYQRQQRDTERFRATASIRLKEMMSAAQATAKKPPVLVKKIAGGC